MINTQVQKEISIDDLMFLNNLLTCDTTEMTDSGLKKTKIAALSESDLQEAGEEIIEYVEGGLIDNYITIDINGKMRIYQERYATCWSSGYTMIEGDPAKLWDYWYTYIDNTIDE